MTDSRVLMDGELVKQLRKRRWASQAGFAARAEISARIYGDIEGTKRAVSAAIAKRVSKTLRLVKDEITLEALTILEFFVDGLSSVKLPGLKTKDQRELDHAGDADMAGNHEQAIFICRRLLSGITGKEVERRMAIEIRLAAFLDNAGRHKEALAQLSDDLWRHNAPPAIARSSELSLRYYPTPSRLLGCRATGTKAAH